MNPRLMLLVFCQGLFMTNNVTFIAINGLVGFALAPVGWMATLPVTGYVAGGALATGLVGRHQRQYGRQKTFMIGLVVAIISAAACAWAAITRDFWLLNLATLAAYGTASNTRKGNTGIFAKTTACVFVQFRDVVA